MLSRTGSDASARLTRSKSATSVKQRRKDPIPQESVDPRTARIHAHTAASIAMGRAIERSSDEMRRSAELSRSGSDASRAGKRATNRGQNIHFSGAAELRRQRSLLQTRTSNIASTLQMPGEHPYRDTFQYTVSPPPEYAILDGYGSEPSSYRRLRKAKSSLSPRQRAQSLHNMSSFASCSPASARTLRNVKSSLGDAEQGLKHGLKRSISYLRGSSSNLSKAFNRGESQNQYHDEAIQLAQEQFLNGLEHQRLNKQSSFLFAPKARREQKAFRKTVRSNRTTEFGDGVKSDNQAELQLKPESKARSLSASLRDKFKRAFGKSSKDKFPAQQLDATRPHFRDYVDGTGTESSLDQYFVGDNDPTTRGSLYIPSSNDHDFLEDLDRMSSTLRSAQSIESLHSNSRSRVTSWTNSTITNSLAGRSTPVERKRLSIIKEDGGPHQPTSSMGRHVGGIDIFRKPLPAQDTHGQPVAPVDSQRIYSALMKRIGQEEADAGSIHDLVTPQNSTASIPPTSAQTYRTAPTIRAVHSQASLHTIAPDKEHRQFSIGKPTWQEDSGVTPQQLAQHNENLERRNREQLEEKEEQSSFFPFSDQGKPRTSKPSPFKLALKARKESQGTSESETGSVVVSRPEPSSGQIHGRYGMSSESIYSTTTGGHSDPRNASGHFSADDPDESSPVPGMATIIPTKASRYPRPAPDLMRLHRTRSSERGEWKGWAEHQMSSLDRRNSQNRSSHHREHAQIDDEDTDIGAEPPRPSTSMGLSRLQSQRSTRNANADPAGSRPGSSMINDRFTLLDVMEVPRNNTSGVIRGKKSQISFSFKKKDENSPPISTPGRLQASGQRLRRKAASVATLRGPTPSPKATTPTPKSRIASTFGGWGSFGRNITNETDRNLSRLSRPFDMDCPDANRPFEPEYLGTEQPMQAIGKAARLSVAPAGTTPAMTPGYSGDDEGGDTALPEVRTPGDKRMMMSSKRMVSNFLRSRRKNHQARAQMDDQTTTEGSSPAFV